MTKYYVGIGFNYWSELEVEADSREDAELLAEELIFDKFNDDVASVDVDVEYVEEAD